MHAAGLSRTCTMSCDQTYPFPQVFLVDAGGGLQHPDQPPSLVPCWSHLSAQGTVRRKSHGGMGVSPCTALMVLMLFLLVFAGLGFEAYEIYKMQKELRQVRWFWQVCLRVLYLLVSKWLQWCYQLPVRSDRDGSSLVGRTLQSWFNEGKSVKKGVSFCASAGLCWGGGWVGGCKLWVENRAGKVTQSCSYSLIINVGSPLTFKHADFSLICSICGHRSRETGNPLCSERAQRVACWCDVVMRFLVSVFCLTEGETREWV